MAFERHSPTARVPGLVALHTHTLGGGSAYRRLPSPWGALVFTLGGRRRVRPRGQDVILEPRIALHGAGEPWSDCKEAPDGRGIWLALLAPWAAVRLQQSSGWQADLASRLERCEPSAVMGQFEAAVGDYLDPTPVPDTAALATALFEEAGAGRVGDRMLRQGRAARAAFMADYGMTPKVWARLCRFSADVKRLHGSPWTGFDQVEPDHFDQSHRIHEFRAWAGMTPQSYRRAVAGTERVWAVPLR